MSISEGPEDLGRTHNEEQTPVHESSGAVSELTDRFSGDLGNVTVRNAPVLQFARNIVYDAPNKKAWTERWREILDDTATLRLPENIDEDGEALCRVMLMRGYATLTCPNMDADTIDRTMREMEKLTGSSVPHIAAAAHHLLGKMHMLDAGLPTNLQEIDIDEANRSIAKRLKGFSHYVAVKPTDVIGDPIQLSGRADLPASTLDESYRDKVPAGAELPVKRIVPPNRLIGTGMEAIGALQMLIDNHPAAAEPLRTAIAALDEHLREFAATDTEFNNLNIELARFATTGLAAHLHQRGLWGAKEKEHTFLSQCQTVRNLSRKIQMLHDAQKLDGWKKAEFEACAAAGLAMAAEQEMHKQVYLRSMLENLKWYMETRPDDKGGRAAAKKVIGHDCIYALVIKTHGTKEQQQEFAELLKPEEV